MSKEELLKKLEEYCELEENWDGYGGAKLSTETIDNTKIIIEEFENSIEHMMISPSDSILFRLKTKENNYTFLLDVGSTTFSWAYISDDNDLAKYKEADDIPLDWEELFSIVKQYCI